MLYKKETLKIQTKLFQKVLIENNTNSHREKTNNTKNECDIYLHTLTVVYYHGGTYRWKFPVPLS